MSELDLVRLRAECEKVLVLLAGGATPSKKLWIDFDRAFSPHTCLALLDRVAELEQEVARLRTGRHIGRERALKRAEAWKAVAEAILEVTNELLGDQPVVYPHIEELWDKARNLEGEP